MQAAPKAPATKEQLLEAKASLRREMGLERGGAGTAAAPSKAAAMAPAAPAAWPKGMAAAAAAAPEPAPVIHTLASYFMLSSKSESKALRGAGAPAAAAAATPAPAVPVASSSTAPWQSQQDFPPVSSAASPSAWPQAVAEKGPQKQQQAGPSASPRPAPAVAPPPPPRQSTPPLPPSPPAAVHQSFEGTVGMEYFDESDDASKMTKAQRKNLKRAERKNRLYLRTRNGQDGEGGSDDEDLADDDELGGGDGGDRGYDEPLSSSATAELEALRDAEHAAIMEDMFVQALVCRKAMAALRNVQRLAFSWWQAAAAVQRFGGDLSAGVAWLLECGDASVEDIAVMPLTSGAERGGWPDMDLGEELQRLAEVQAGLGVSAEEVQSAVVEALGDVPLAIKLMTNQLQVAAGAREQRHNVNGSEHSGFARPRGAAGVMLMQSDPVADVPMGGRFSSGSLRGMIGSGSQQQLADLDSAGGGLPRLTGSWGFAGSQGAGSSEDASASLGGWNPGGGSSSLGQLGGGSGGGSGLLGSTSSSLFGGFQEGGGSRFAGLWGGGGQ